MFTAQDMTTDSYDAYDGKTPHLLNIHSTCNMQHTLEMTKNASKRTRRRYRFPHEHEDKRPLNLSPCIGRSSYSLSLDILEA